MTAAPPLSVVMPVHNAVPYLAQSIHSILAQTLSDFEFVILDDASTDDSRAIIRSWAGQDRRIRLVETDTQLGPAASADRVVREARAPLCARMDADDVSHPGRLRAQWELLRTRPEVSLVGTLWEGIDREGRLVRPRDRWHLLQSTFYAPFPHGSIMFRRELFLTLAGYRRACNYWEDHDLYFRMADWGPIMVLCDAFYHYRFHSGSTTAGNDAKRMLAVALMYRCVDHLRKGQDYTPLLAEDSVSGEPLEPRLLYSIGAPRLWAGEAPAILRYLRRVTYRAPDALLLRMLMLVLWGEVSPRSLRRLLGTFIWLRDRVASARIRDGTAVEWHLPGVSRRRS